MDRVKGLGDGRGPGTLAKTASAVLGMLVGGVILWAVGTGIRGLIGFLW